jgi:hypothetical protein
MARTAHAIRKNSRAETGRQLQARVVRFARGRLRLRITRSYSHGHNRE